MLKIIIACGGSGGHIFPGIALARELAERDGRNDILIVCSMRPFDREILAKSGCSFEAIPCCPYAATINPVKIFTFLISLFSSLFASLSLLRRYRPDCVAGFGGFVSVPVVFAAWILKIPRLIHEQNVIAGMANKTISLVADRVAVSFADTERFFSKEKVIDLGNPLRKSLFGIDKKKARRELGLNREGLILLILGGSQGARFINKVTIDAITGMSEDAKRIIQLIHITGRCDYDYVKDKYSKSNIKSRVFPFLDEIGNAYAAADLVIARAGATTIAELTCLGKPSILIPYPEKRVHQLENANFLSGKKASVTIEEKGLSAMRMREAISGLSTDLAGLEEMAGNSKRLGRPDAASRLAEEVMRLSRRAGC